MTAPSDPVRARLAEMYDGRGEADPLADYAAYDAALRTALDEFDYYAEHGTDDEKDVIAAIRSRVSAALGVTE